MMIDVLILVFDDKEPSQCRPWGGVGLQCQANEIFHGTEGTKRQNLRGGGERKWLQVPWFLYIFEV